ncbi:MAG TPA: Fur family transcriptional regulator [Kofleriaceae bacterium]
MKGRGYITALQRELRNALRGRGLRATPTRLRVFEMIADADRPLSHAELSQLLPGDHDRVTVFRALNTLSEAGLVHRVDLGDRVWRYTRATEGAAFVCTSCGAITPLRDVKLDAEGPQALRRGAVRILVQGRCDACG